MVAVLFASCLIAGAVRVAYPAQLSESQVTTRLQRAAALDPHNDSIQERLGLAELWGEGDRSDALTHLRQAIALNPNRAEYWSNLAPGCFAAGDLDCAESGFARAEQLAPRRPRYRWDLANYYLVNGRREPALGAFSELLAITPEDARSALDICLRAYGDVPLIWNRVVRPSHNARIQLTFLTLMAERQIGDTAPYWEEIRGSHFAFHDAAPYVDSLIANGSYELALRVWTDMEQRSVVSSNGTSGIYNGDFETDPLNAGFDWHLYNQQYLDVSIDRDTAHSGRQSLRIDFSVPHNDDYTPVYTVFPVTPGEAMTLSAWVKSDSITSDSGPRLRVVDPNCATCLDISSEDTTGTTGWHEIAVTFTPKPQTKAIRVLVWRNRSRTYPMDISGTFWLDAVSLKPSVSMATSK